MYNKFSKVIYCRPSLQGSSIPKGAVGEVLAYLHHPVTSKLLVDFYSYGKFIVPAGSVKRVEED